MEQISETSPVCSEEKPLIKPAAWWQDAVKPVSVYCSGGERRLEVRRSAADMSQCTFCKQLNGQMSCVSTRLKSLVSNQILFVRKLAFSLCKQWLDTAGWGGLLDEGSGPPSGVSPEGHRSWLSSVLQVTSQDVTNSTRTHGVCWCSSENTPLKPSRQSDPAVQRAALHVKLSEPRASLGRPR
ncbi:hypothetical protein FQA47_025615 [Oryzias melastigma]|uniref:Uncharacterized protein n=1 Tax=Oryzias melastigma TaxID=30732 RepID=A0A834F870_ORYME|nr:hypothetical protein FQA47_025615 [Oryzias melastigma]